MVALQPRWRMEQLKIGKTNTLKVIKQLDFGIYLDGLDRGEILMPAQYAPQGTNPGDMIKCFIYFDSEDRIIATTLEPYAETDDFAYLEVVAANQTGAFLNWGLPKDLFVPFREQLSKMTPGKRYVVYIYYDLHSNRIAASERIEKFLNREPNQYKVGEAVSILFFHKSDIGYKAVLDQKFLGLLHNSDVFMNVQTGMEMVGYIKQLKDDGKIDLVLQKPGYEAIDEQAAFLLDKLKIRGGFLNLNDKSTSEVIYDQLGMSKKTFKKAVGSLYKRRLISLEEGGIRLNP